jgi:hypothetical protein
MVNMPLLMIGPLGKQGAVQRIGKSGKKVNIQETAWGEK